MSEEASSKIQEQLRQTTAILAAVAESLASVSSMPADIRLLQREVATLAAQVEKLDRTLHDPALPGLATEVDRLKQDQLRRDRRMNRVEGAAISGVIAWLIALVVFVIQWKGDQ